MPFRLFRALPGLPPPPLAGRDLRRAHSLGCRVRRSSCCDLSPARPPPGGHPSSQEVLFLLLFLTILSSTVAFSCVCSLIRFFFSSLRHEQGLAFASRFFRPISRHIPFPTNTALEKPRRKRRQHEVLISTGIGHGAAGAGKGRQQRLPRPPRPARRAQQGRAGQRPQRQQPRGLRGPDR